VDLFIAGGSPLDEQQIGTSTRRKTSCCKSSGGFASGRKCQIDSGGMCLAFSSSREKRSIDYLSRGAETLGVVDLLDRALQTVKARE
jgi:hypothetical protein